MIRKYAFVIETYLGFLILILLNILLFKKTAAFIGVQPHPYWIVILLIASRYGTLQGLFAGVVAAVLYLFLGSHAGLLKLSSFNFPHGVYKMPFFFILTGGVLGEIRSFYKTKFMDLKKQHHEKFTQLQDLGVQYAALSESKQELDGRIAFQSTSMLRLFERLNDLEKLELESLYNKIPELIAEQLNVQCSSIYLIKDNQLRCHRRYGQKDKHKLPHTVELTDGMMGEAIKAKKVIAINQMYTEEEMSEYNELGLIMSAPITLKDESIVGVINIEKMPFFDFNSNSVNVFEMLSLWVSMLVDKAVQFQKLKDKNIADEITGAYNYYYFQKCLKYEIARAKRFDMPLSLMLIEVDKFEEMNDEEQKNVLVVLNWIFSNLLRETDIIAKYTNDSTFAVILPGQNNEQGDIIVNRLMKEINNYQLRPFTDEDIILSLKIGLSTLQLSEGSYDSLIKAAEERVKYGGVRNESDIYDDLQYLLNSEKSTDTKNGPQRSLKKIRPSSQI